MISLDQVNELLATASEEAYQERLNMEYIAMQCELNQYLLDQYQALMAADDDAGMYGRMV